MGPGAVATTSAEARLIPRRLLGPSVCSGSRSSCSAHQLIGKLAVPIESAAASEIEWVPAFNQSGQLTNGHRVFHGFCAAVFWRTLMYQTAPEVELPSYQLPE